MVTRLSGHALERAYRKPLRSACRRVPLKTCMLNGRPTKGGARVARRRIVCRRAHAVHLQSKLASNVASDPLMSLNYVGVEGGCVIYVAGRSGPHFVADRARYASLCVVRGKIPVFDPSRRWSRALKCSARLLRFLERYRMPVIIA